MKHWKQAGLILLIAAVICSGAWLFTSEDYPMTETAAAAMSGSNTITVTEKSGLAIFTPSEPTVGLVFYPEEQVEYTSYAPLMKMLAENGILCVISKLPLFPSLTEIDTADILLQFPHMDTWYIGGHGLGGTMAADHAAASDAFQGVILLGSHSNADLKDSGLRALTIYGTRDDVLSMKVYEENRSRLPEDTVEIPLEGGNHAQFGSYGKQEGDGTALISAFEQQVQAMSEIVQFMVLSEEELPQYEYEQYTFWLEQENGSALRSVLTLTPETKQYTLSEPVYSSHLNAGSYVIENGILICSSWGGNTVYCFEVTEQGLVYRAADSADIYAHGSVFAENPNEQKPVPDGGVYAQLMICN